MAVTGVTFDSNHLPGDYDFSLLTITDFVLQAILLMFDTSCWQKRRSRARSRLSRCSRCLVNRVLRVITFLHSWTPVFSLVASCSDYRHNENWHTVHEAVRFGNILLLLRPSKPPSFIRVPRVQQVFVDNDSENLFRKFALFKGSLCTHAQGWRSITIRIMLRWPHNTGTQ